MLFLAPAAFVVFLGAIFGLIRRGFDAQGNWQRGGAKWLAGVVAALFLWLWALKNVPPPYPLENLGRFEMPQKAK